MPSPAPAKADAIERALAAILPQLAKARELLIVLNDPQRDTPSQLVLKPLAKSLGQSRIRCIVATGSHMIELGAQMQFMAMLGQAMGVQRVGLAWHDSLDPELRPIGREGWLGHPWLTEGDGPVLAIGSCEPHYFAGITGAHKTVTIGCASYDDIQANHAGALSPHSRPCLLAGNPVHEGVVKMFQALEARRPVLAVNLLCAGGAVIDAAGGPPLAALEQLRPAVLAAFVHSIPAPADGLILHVGGALGQSFYQADKGIKNSEWAVRDGGAIILDAPCPDGIGQDDFFHMLRACPSFAAAEARIRERGYYLGDHKALKLRYLRDVRKVRVFAVCPGLSADDCAVLGFVKAESVQAAVASAGQATGKDRIYRVQDAGNCCVQAEGVG